MFCRRESHGHLLVVIYFVIFRRGVTKGSRPVFMRIHNMDIYVYLPETGLAH